MTNATFEARHNHFDHEHLVDGLLTISFYQRRYSACESLAIDVEPEYECYRDVGSSTCALLDAINGAAPLCSTVPASNRVSLSFTDDGCGYSESNRCEGRVEWRPEIEIFKPFGE